MAVLNQQWPTLIDVATRFGDDGRILTIAEILSQINNVLDEMPVYEANDGKRNVSVQRTGLPKGTYRLLNSGVPPEKSTTVQITDTAGMLESYAEVDKALADMSGDPAGFRLSEDKAFLEGMSQTMAQGIFYGNQLVNPERFTGFAPRYNTVNSSNALNAVNVIDAGGTGTTNTSIWLVVWGQETAFGFYPRGSQAGLLHEDRGQRTLYDANGGRYEGYRTHYKWDLGVAVKDWRYLVRICNIDVTKLRTKVDMTGNPPPGGPADLVELMNDAVRRIPNINMGRAAFYMNRGAAAAIDRQMRTFFNVRLTLEEAGGKKFTSFDGIPMRIVDQLLSTEARVV